MKSNPTISSADKAVPADTAVNGKWRVLLLLSLAELLAMGTWFSASAVVPSVKLQPGTSADAGRAWLTMSVQAGFVVGSVFSALLNLADRLPARLACLRLRLCWQRCVPA